MNGAVGRVEVTIGGFGGHDRSGLAGVDGGAGRNITTHMVVTPAHGPTALIVVVVATQDEVHSIAIE